MSTAGKKCLSAVQRNWSKLRSLNQSHAQHIRDELSQVRGLIPTLMKQRNGQQWSAEDRASLLRDLRTLSNLSPYLIPILMPGGIFMLPLVAYWMDRRRNVRKENNTQNLN